MCPGTCHEKKGKRGLCSKIQDTVLQGGRVLLPVVALGRAQVCPGMRVIWRIFRSVGVAICATTMPNYMLS